jgi:hypothetical protein
MPRIHLVKTIDSQIKALSVLDGDTGVEVMPTKKVLTHRNMNYTVVRVPDDAKVYVAPMYDGELETSSVVDMILIVPRNE